MIGLLVIRGCSQRLVSELGCTNLWMVVIEVQCDDRTFEEFGEASFVMMIQKETDRPKGGVG